MQNSYFKGFIDTESGQVPLISPIWTGSDVWNTIKIRWNTGRMSYSVSPGLYAIGKPDENSSVFVTANFKLSFDHLRRALRGINAWILILDTKGINVWCAAGKGTFGTQELVDRIQSTMLGKIVKHRRIILPQLGAPGVEAHKVRIETGFRVIFGPVRAEDIGNFIEAGYKSSEEMRTVKFPLKERVKLVPVELSYGKYYLLIVPAVFFILSGLTVYGYSVDLAWTSGGRACLNLLTAFVAGCVLTPILLPWIPFRRFSFKGLTLGWILSLILLYLGVMGDSLVEIISWFLIIGGISSFLAMNFTGSSTFTSLSGVQKEIKTALPVQIGFSAIGFIGWVVARFI